MSERRVLVNENSLIAIGAAIREKNGTNNSYKPGDMAAAVLEIETGITPEGSYEITENGEYDITTYATAIVNVEGSGSGGDIEIPVITGNCTYRFAYNGWNWALDAFGKQMRTENITNAEYMFSSSNILKNIPFDLDFTKNTYVEARYLFANCNELTELPKLNNFYPNNMANLMSGVTKLRYLPEDFGVDWNWDRIHTYTYSGANSFFENCYSLRRIPSSFLEKFHNLYTSSYGCIYGRAFLNCLHLDEVCNLRVVSSTLTSNTLDETFKNCKNLRRFTFETNEDGTPKTANWKAQTINLNYSVGYELTYEFYGRSGSLYNSGRTIDKVIYDDATYQALKNDPDAYVCGYTTGGEYPHRYSFYNKASAIETINSLPDTSAYLATAGGTNTIKFEGAAGELTDAGAINTMTEENIAVAAAKGWTVSFV